eukprot:g3363.t1
MVVLAASVISKTGKALVSRQFVEMSRVRVEGLLAALPKLVGTGRQHTFVETGNIRYVFQPVENLYLLLLTNKNSNIVEDLETLRLLSKVLPEYASPVDEEHVLEAAFELIFAFDEVISMGHKENISFSQIKQNIEMESMEEKLHNMIIQTKIDETKDHMRKVAKKLDQDKIEKAKTERTGPGVSSYSMSSYQDTGMGGGGGSSDFDVHPTFKMPTIDSSSASSGRKKGLQLGKGRKNKDIIESLRAEGETVETDISVTKASSGAASRPRRIASEQVTMSIDEKMTATLNRDGGIELLEVNGVMTLEVNVEEASRLCVELDMGANKGFNFKTHPNIDKNLYLAENKLGLRDPNRPFPVGTSLAVLKWKWSTKEDSKLPLTLNCWPSPSGSETYVNMDYEAAADYELKNVCISIPLPSGKAPSVNEVDGDYQYNERQNVLQWMIDIVDSSNTTGALEFVIPASDPDDFFPVDISFTVDKLMCEIEVQSVADGDSGSNLKWACTKSLRTGDYQIV